MNSVSKAASLLSHNPRLLAKILYANSMNRFGHVPASRLVKAINGVRFEFDFDYGPQLRKMYFGAYEPLTIEMMSQILKKGDTFLDVGASIGYLSARALGMVGSTGQVHSFEPVPKDYERLEKLATMNPAYTIVTNRWALGDEEGTLEMDVTCLPWIGWNTLVPAFMRRDAWKESIPVRILRLDDYIMERGADLGNLTLIKIDTEGFEFPVLRGLRRYFEKGCNLPAILCEINPRAYPLLAMRLAQLTAFMREMGYDAFSLLNLRQRVDLSKLEQTTDVLFLPEHAN